MTDWVKPFPAVELRRYDLKQTGLTDAQIEALTDEDMETIADKMDCFIEDYYFDNQVWEHVLEIATDCLAARRNHENHQT